MSTKTVNAVSLRLRALEVGDVDHGVEVDACRADASNEVVRKLRDKLERYRRHRARRAGWVRRFVPTGLWPLDERLPHGGLPCGAITEVYADGAGVGSMTLALRMAGGRDEGTEGRRDGGRKIETSKRRNIEMGRGGGDRRGPIVVVDTYGDFYPPAVVPLGIALDRLIVLRVRNEKDAFWAAEQSLRCAAVTAVVAPLERIDERDSRRLQLAAETSGCIGIVLRPMHRRSKSFAAVQMLVEGRSDEATKRRSDGGTKGRRDGGREVEMPGAMFPRSGSMPMHQGVGSAVRTSSHLSADSGPATWADSQVDPSVSFDSVVFEEGALGLRDGYFCRLTLLAVREGMPTSPCWVDLYHETGTCDVRSLPVDRPVAKTG